VVNNIHDIPQVKRFIAVMLLTCFIVCIYGLYSYFATGIRASAPFEGAEGEANTLSGYIVLLFSLMMGLLLYHDSARLRFGLVLCMSASLLALIFTLSRSGWISFIFMYIVFIFVSKKSKPILIVGFLFLLVLAPVLTPKAVHERVHETFVGYGDVGNYRVMGKKMTVDESTAARINSWGDAFKKLARKPIFGYGIPSSAVLDNQFARVMTETGLVGLLAFLFLLSRIFRLAYFAMINPRDNGLARGISVGFLAGFFGLLIHCFSASTFILIRIMEPFWFLMAVIVVLPEILQDENRPPVIYTT
jgi:O-antigen ligase